MSQKFRTLSTLNLPQLEQELAQWWIQHSTFQKSISARDGQPSFVFYEGPPSANGMPGIHHVISRTIKDLFCRYKTMQGFQVQRKAGWDTHGLPVELGVEKELGITKEDIGTKISVAEYNAKCKEAVLRYQDKWSDITSKMGYWVDLANPYVTYHTPYMETLWWCLKELHTKGYLYKSVSIQPYSPAAGTGLSSHELNQPGTYKDVKDTSATVLFEVERNDKTAILLDIAQKHNVDLVHVMAWTTTPWTLPSNLGLTVGDNITYVLVKTLNPYTHQLQAVVLAEALLHKYFKDEGLNASFEDFTPEQKIIPYAILHSVKGSELVGLKYKQLLPFASNAVDLTGGVPFRIISGDFVTTEDGTGIVHTAPAFGADDYRVGQKNNLGIICLVDREGKFVKGTGEYSGRFVKNYKDDPNYVDVNVDICVDLKKRGLAFKVEKYEHSYPHCWRTDKPIIYYPLDAWFIKTTAVKEKMMAHNATINWKPKSTGEGRFGNWLENMVDWNLSRSRYWGTPLPVWRTADGAEEICVGSVQELVNEINYANKYMLEHAANGQHDWLQLIEKNEAYLAMHTDGEHDLHKPYVDDITLVSKSGQVMQREPDLIDVWFDSGAMPYAQQGIEFAERLKAGDAEAWKHFPADFIAEGVDQTRGWFYTLHVLGCMLFDNVAYKAVVSNGLVLDKNGNKMSKRLGNVVDPFETIDKYSADATRWYLVTNASPWDSVKFDESGIVEAQRKFFGTLYNTYSFFSLYANVDGFSFSEQYLPLPERPEIDRWVISKLHSLISSVQQSMDEYEPTRAARAIQEFVDEHLSNWHVRLSRKRFWRGEYQHDKICAYQTLFECLNTIAKLMAPIAPFFAEWLYQSLNDVCQQEQAESVHLAQFPIADQQKIDVTLEQQMELAQNACSLILSIRKKEKLKVRQPLRKVMVPVMNDTMKKQLSSVQDLICTETNIKEIEYLEASNNVISKKAKANFKVLGAKLGANMKAAAELIKNFTAAEIGEIEATGKHTVNISGQVVEITADEVEITADNIEGWSVASNSGLTVALDITLDDELISEGIAREFVNRVQNLRKESGLDVTDRIVLHITSEPKRVADALAAFDGYICSEVLANEIKVVNSITTPYTFEINEYEVLVQLDKA
jgi:isoleucyl-tRNA synthetase